MQEALAVLVLVVLVTALGAVCMLPLDALLEAAWFLLALGTVIGLPGGLAWHIGLYRHLRPRGLLPRGWIWRPVSLNALVEPPARTPVLALCGLGAGGFALMLLGILCLAAAVVRIWAFGQ